MIEIHQSNRLEVLAEALFQALGGEAADPFSAPWVMVPNPWVGCWLQLRLAEARGIAVNLELPLPASFFWRVSRA